MITNINIRIDKELKEEAEKVFENLGINQTVAINMFYRQVVRTNSIPFNLIAENNEKGKEQEK